MALTFATAEWTNAWFSKLRSDDLTLREGATWNHGPIVLHVDASSDAGLAEDVFLRIFVHEGEVRDVKLVSAADATPAPYVLGGPYARWKAVLRGEGDIVQAVRDGRLRCRGDLPTIERGAGLLSCLAATAASLDTSYPDDEPAAEPAAAGSAR